MGHAFFQLLGTCRVRMEFGGFRGRDWVEEGAGTDGSLAHTVVLISECQAFQHEFRGKANPMVEVSSNKWKIDKVSAVLFDKDGTFIDSHCYWGAIIVARSLAICDAFGLDDNSLEGLERSMGFCRRTGRLLPAGPIALVSREEVIAHIIRHLASQNVKVAFDDVARLFREVHKKMLYRIDECVRPILDAKPLFDALQKKCVPMAVVTTDSIDNTQAILSKLGLSDYFSTVVGKESSNQPKETGEPALIAIKELGVAAAGVICIGDAPMDILMARNSGCRACIGVATGQIPAEELLRHTPYVVSKLSELSVTLPF